MKICSRCKEDKDELEYKIRYRKAGKKSKQATFLNNTCKKCDSEISNAHYFLNKDNADFKKDWLKKSRDYYHKNKIAISEKMKIKRQTPEYKKMMSDYRSKNKEKIFSQEIITKNRYHEKNKIPITDKYCSHMITSQIEIKKEDITPNMIEIKRVQILIKRVKNEIFKIKKQK